MATVSTTVVSHAWKQFARELFKYLGQKNVTTALIMEKVGVTSAAVSMWRNAKHPPSDENFEALVAFLREQEDDPAEIDRLEQLYRAAKGRVSKHEITIELFKAIAKQLPEWANENFASFLYDYIGDTTVAFGGRADQLQSLTEWTLPGRAKDLPSILTTGFAGQGKTTLLLRWLQNVEPTARIVYVPVTSAIETNEIEKFYEVLAAQLVEQTSGKKIGTKARDVDYRRRCLAELKNIAAGDQRTLVIIDAVDEFLDGEIDPEIVKPRSELLQFIVSARTVAGDDETTAWPTRLRWSDPKILDLSSLTFEEVQEVIKSLPDEACPAIQTYEADLWRLTEGDPLLLNCYMQMLQAPEVGKMPLDPDRLRDFDKGYGGFLKGLLLDAKKSRFGGYDRRIYEVILSVLALSHGPMHASELEAVCKIALRDPTFGLTREHIRPISHILRGDPMAVGYSLQHLRFNEYFREKHYLGEGGLRDIRAAFASYIKSALDNVLVAPVVVPTYISKF